MAGRDDKELFDQGFEALAGDETGEEQQALFEELAERIEEPGLQDAILKRYSDYGRTLLGDALPSHVDPRVAKGIERLLGDVSDVRVHSGPVATEAARAMDARAFAVGDRDIFVDRAQLDPSSREGGALLAHEIAHTRDASTGFALSAKHGTDTSAREQFAHEIEHTFAREWELEEAGESVVRSSKEPPTAKGASGEATDPEVDRDALAHKVAEVLMKQDKRAADRTGRW